MRKSNGVATNKGLSGWMLLWCTLPLWVACGRTPLLPVCSIDVTPATLDFGQVAAGGLATMNINVADHGSDICLISSVGLDPSSDPSFGLGPQTPASLVMYPGEHTTVSVTFSPASVRVPLQRIGALVLQTNDPSRHRVEVRLAGKIQTNCAIAVSPLVVDFGQVPINSTAAGSVSVTSTGRGPCDIAGIAIGQGSDPQFALGPGQASSFMLSPGDEQSIVLAFNATDLSAPHHRTGNLVFASTDSTQATTTIPLSADIDIGCWLTIAPDSLDFDNVIINTATKRAVTLVNQGTDSCQVSGVGFDPSTDPGFTFAPGQALAFTVAPGASRAISVSFGTCDSAPPHVRTGTLVAQTGNSRAPSLSIPLTATVSTACTKASLAIASLGKVAHYGNQSAGDNTDAFQNYINTQSNATMALFGNVVGSPRNFTLTADFLKNYDVIILQALEDSEYGGFWIDFTHDEITALYNWVNNGGGLIALSGYGGDSDEVQPLNLLLSSSFGITYQPTDIFIESDCADNLCYCADGSIPFGGWNASDTPLIDNLNSTNHQVGAFYGRPIICPDCQVMGTWRNNTLVAAHKQVGAGRVFAFADEWVTYTSQWNGDPTFQSQTQCENRTADKIYDVPQFWYNVFRWVSGGSVCFTINDPSVTPIPFCPR